MLGNPPFEASTVRESLRVGVLPAGRRSVCDTMGFTFSSMAMTNYDTSRAASGYVMPR